MEENVKSHFVFYYYINGANAISLGVSLSLRPLNIEFHLPFGFVRIGMEPKQRVVYYATQGWRYRAFGYHGRS